MTASEFYDAGPLARIAINLFHGWGYNFYREENLLRADDLMIRAKAGWLLGEARASVEKAEADLRRAMPSPTRERPFPDPAAMADAQALERLSRALGALEARIRAEPVPENDRMTQVYRGERATLTRLGRCDETLIGQAELLRAKLEGKDGTAVMAAQPVIESGLAAIAETLRERHGLLFSTAWTSGQ